MPAALVPKRIEDFIFYYYAKLVIAPSAGFAGNYRFIVDRYRKLKAGKIRMADYERELLHLAQLPGTCTYCQKKDTNALPSEIVPRSAGGPIGIHNLVLACKKCRESKDGKDLVAWWCGELAHPLDELPRVPIGLYLKIAYEGHHVTFSLGQKCTDLAGLFPLPMAQSGADPAARARRR